MDYRPSFFLLLFTLLASMQHLNGADNENVRYQQNYAPIWGQQNIQVLDQGREVQLSVGEYSGGSGIKSWHQYGSGWFSMRIKMPQKDSTGVITTFYLRSDDSNDTQDEIDFELLGGNNKDHYLLHTNIFIHGQGGREQQFKFWFDPTADFHNYSLLWNEKHLVFFVDDTPIRVYNDIIVAYPKQAMTIMATIWNGTWASGGKPMNWNDGPFEAHYRGFGINACRTQKTGYGPDPECYSSRFWWNAEKYWSLDPAQQRAYRNVRSKYLLYDYCSHQPQNPECK